MSIYNWLCLLGVPALILAIGRWIWKFCTDQRRDSAAVRAGLQAILRAELIRDYNKWTEREYAPIWARDNFENVYKHYHNLGENGVMNGLRDEFLTLPTEKGVANE